MLRTAKMSPFMLERVELEIGRQAPWRTVPSASRPGVDWLTRLVISGDGRSYCYSYDRAQNDLLLIEGLDLPAPG